jgi:hypothetical protein
MERKIVQSPLAIAYFLALLAFSSPAAAAPTPEERQACEADAYRLCGHAIPDEQRVKACLMGNMRRLSPGCRRAFRRR